MQLLDPLPRDALRGKVGGIASNNWGGRRGASTYFQTSPIAVWCAAHGSASGVAEGLGTWGLVARWRSARSRADLCQNYGPGPDYVSSREVGRKWKGAQKVRTRPMGLHGRRRLETWIFE